MKRLFAGVFMAALLAGLAGTASAAQYPNAACPDTLLITQTQDPVALCHPVVSDTVFGIQGVVTAIDSIASGSYSFFIQQAGGGPYSGLNVFTGLTNYQGTLAGTPTGGNIFYGDLLAIDGKMDEFRGLTELSGFDLSQSTNDIVVRRNSAGNPFPPFHISTVTELNWVPLAPGSDQEPWEACLVKIRGPLVCGRIIGTGVGTNTMLVTTPGGTDSIAVDGFVLTSLAPLSVGSPIDSVQGVVSQTIISSVPSYRILLRNTDDLFAAAPPNVIDAYPVAEALIRVIFDRPVDQTTAEDPANYSLFSFGTVFTVTLQPGGKSVLVEVDAAADHGTAEAITVSGVISKSGLPMGGAQSRTFIMGVLSIAEVQQPDAVGLAENPCHDRSRYTLATGANGVRLTFRGISTAGFGTLEYLEDAAGGLRSGMPVFGSPVNLLEGHEYILSGQVQEFDGISTQLAGGMTEGGNIQYIEDLGVAAHAVPQLQTVHVLSDSSCDVTQTLVNAEDYEGVLVKLSLVRIVENRLAGEGFLIAGPNPSFTDTMLVANQLGAYTFKPDSMHTVDITGVLNWRNGGFPWRVTPRNNADIVDYGFDKRLGVGPEGNGSGDLRMAVSPNPSRTARVSFTLPRGGEVNLGVFDLTGRRVATLIHAKLPAGDFTKLWNGRDDAGALSRSGVYFYRLRLGDDLISTKAIKLD